MLERLDRFQRPPQQAALDEFLKIQLTPKTESSKKMPIVSCLLLANEALTYRFELQIELVVLSLEQVMLKRIPINLRGLFTSFLFVEIYPAPSPSSRVVQG